MSINFAYPTGYSWLLGWKTGLILFLIGCFAVGRIWLRGEHSENDWWGMFFGFFAIFLAGFYELQGCTEEILQKKNKLASNREIYLGLFLVFLLSLWVVVRFVYSFWHF